MRVVGAGQRVRRGRTGTARSDAAAALCCCMAPASAATVILDPRHRGDPLLVMPAVDV